MNDVYVQEHSFSGYWAQQIFFTDWLRFEGGLRGDFFFFDVEQPAAAARAPIPNFDAVYLNGYTTAGLPSPKANLILTPLEDTELYLNFGRGFHSNDARSPSPAPSPAPAHRAPAWSRQSNRRRS